jgi:hypothetical protein
MKKEGGSEGWLAFEDGFGAAYFLIGPYLSLFNVI